MRRTLRSRGFRIRPLLWRLGLLGLGSKFVFLYFVLIFFFVWGGGVGV